MDSAAPATSAPPGDPALAQHRARRNRAFALGEAKARRRAISADAYLFLYKELVSLAGEQKVCAPGLTPLAAALGGRAAMITRWRTVLSCLMWRTSHPDCQLTLRAITPLLAPDPGVASTPTAVPVMAPQQNVPRAVDVAALLAPHTRSHAEHAAALRQTLATSHALLDVYTDEPGACA